MGCGVGGDGGGCVMWIENLWCVYVWMIWRVDILCMGVGKCVGVILGKFVLLLGVWLFFMGLEWVICFFWLVIGFGGIWDY